MKGNDMAASEIRLQGFPGFAWQHYYALTKPKVVLLISFTTLVGMLLSTQGVTPWQPMLFGLVGIALAAACGAVINHIIDQRIDNLMHRTHWRPFPSGRMDTPHALGFALLLGAVSMLVLTLLVNPLTALLTFFALIGYAVIYTLFLKRNTPQNIVWGGLAGAAPPLLGWCAITDQSPALAVADDHLRLDPAPFLAPGDPATG
jgi:protoheme IX farnesyltransferase